MINGTNHSVRSHSGLHEEILNDPYQVNRKLMKQAASHFALDESVVSMGTPGFQAQRRSGITVRPESAQPHRQTKLRKNKLASQSMKFNDVTN
jgi:hypothetical protein